MNATKILRYFIYLGVAALLLTPLWVSSSLYFPFITGKAFYFRAVVELIFGAWVILALFDKSARPSFSWLSVSVIGFVAVPLLGVWFGANPWDAIWSNFERMIGWITILHVGMLYFAAGHTIKAKHWHWFFYLSFIVSIIIGINGLREVTQTERIDATLGNPIYLAMYSLFHASLAAFYVVRRIKKAVQENYSLLADWMAYIFAGLGIFNLIVLWHTGTRGGILGLLAGLFVTVGIVAVFQRKRPLVRKVAIVGAIIPIVIVGLFFGFRDSQFVKNQPVLGRFAEIDLQEGNAGARLDTWAIGLEGYTERPAVGWGMGNFNYVFNKHYRPAMHDDATWFDRAHNVLVEWLVAAGPLGVLAYLSLFATAVYLIWREPERGESFSTVERAVLAGLLVAYLVQNLFVFDHLVSYLMFTLLLAWLYQRTADEKPLVDVPAPSRSARMWLGTGVVLLTPILVWVWNGPAYQQAGAIIEGLQQRSQASRLQKQGQTAQANQLREDSLQTFREAVAYGRMGTQEARESLQRAAISVANNTGPDADIAQRFFGAARGSMRAQITYEPRGVRHYVLYGRLLMRYGKHDQAIKQLQTANKISGGQKQSVLFSLARAYRSAGKTEKSLSAYQQAYELPTEFDDVAVKYAAALIRADKVEQSDTVLDEHFGTTTVANPELISAYQRADQPEKTIPLLKKQLEAAQKKSGQNIRQIAQSFVSLAAGYEAVGRQEKAVATLEKLKGQYPMVSDQIDPMIEKIQQGGEIDSVR